jgi:uncharacterized protein YaiI (UPF0178 family)
MRIPDDARIKMKVVSDSFDAADDWIVENVQTNDIVITADIPLADRCLKVGARVIGTTGKPFSEDSIGEAMATRELLSELREAGLMMGGPNPLQESDRSYFLQQLDNMIQSIKRG